MAEWLDDAHGRYLTARGREPWFALQVLLQEDVPRLLACAEVLEELVAGHRQGGINEATWEAAEKALREGRDG